jgi:hypothetical protein
VFSEPTAPAEKEVEYSNIVVGVVYTFLEVSAFEDIPKNQNNNTNQLQQS